MSLQVEAHGKINWYLRVKCPADESGFHRLETVFQEISLHDTLMFDVSEELHISFGGKRYVPLKQNLIWRVWDMLRTEFGAARVRPISVHVIKRLPVGGGLGGGSSNGAATLLALNKLFDLGLNRADLLERAARLGSDCAFFLRGGCAIGRGRGEKLEHVSDIPSRSLALFLPKQRVSTPRAFAKLDRVVAKYGQADPPVSVEEMVNRLRTGSTADIESAMYNDFEVIFPFTQWYKNACSSLRELGCARPMLSGSGSTVYGIAPESMTTSVVTTVAS